jgi:hypothetical protein
VPSTGESGGVLEVRVNGRSSSVPRVEMISVDSDEDVRPMLASHPNIAEYGEQLEVASLILTLLLFWLLQ